MSDLLGEIDQSIAALMSRKAYSMDVHDHEALMRVLVLAKEKIEKSVEEPVPAILFCPFCHVRHVDAPDADAHHTHACQHCGFVWKPMLIRTVGVRFLPGCKDEVR